MQPWQLSERVDEERIRDQVSPRRTKEVDNGTCTGEHGVGKDKMKCLERELGAEALSTMRLIKRVIDPDGV